MPVVEAKREMTPLIHGTIRKPPIRPRERIPDPSGCLPICLLRHKLHTIGLTLSQTDPVFPTGEMCLNRPMILIINQVIQPFIIPLDREIIHPFQIIIKPGSNLVRTHRRDLLRHRDPNIRRLVHIGIR